MEGRVSAGLTMMMNKTPDTPTTQTELRQFGLLFSAILVALFGVLLPWVLGHPFPPWPWAFAAILSAVALILPPVLTPFYRAWMGFGLIAGYVQYPYHHVRALLCCVRTTGHLHGACRTRRAVPQDRGYHSRELPCCQ